MALADRYPRPPQVSLAAPILTEGEEPPVARDGALCEVAGEERVEVHGTIWVADRLVKSDIVSPQEAARDL